MHRGENTYDEEIHKIIDHILRERARNVQKMRSESSEYVRKTTFFLHKELENQNSLGELLWRACTGSLEEKLDES